MDTTLRKLVGNLHRSTPRPPGRGVGLCMELKPGDQLPNCAGHVVTDDLFRELDEQAADDLPGSRDEA